MGLRIPNIEKASEDQREAMRRASAYSLPTNPSERGMKPDDLKKSFWEVVHGSSASLLKEQDRIVAAINNYLMSLYVMIGVGDALNPEDTFGENTQYDESGLVYLANTAWRLLLEHINTNASNESLNDPHKTVQAIMDLIGTHNEDPYAHLLLYNWANQNGMEIGEIRKELGEKETALNTTAENVKSAINEVFGELTSTKEMADANRINLVGIRAQIVGVAKTYVIDTFEKFIEFIKGSITVDIYEDTNGDDQKELHAINAGSLISGDNILITEQGVPDFWFEATNDASKAEKYTYNGVEYELIAYEDGEIVGAMHIAETDYTVIEGYATSAMASANDAAESERNAGMYAQKTKELSDAIYEVQIAPPLSSINEAIILKTPTLSELFTAKEGG